MPRGRVLIWVMIEYFLKSFNATAWGWGIDFGIGLIDFVRNSNANAWGRGIDFG